MINRLLEHLDNPRRHLTFLVGLLALVFALTTVVAWRASAAEQDRYALALKTLDETAAMALDNWAFFFEAYTGSTFESLIGPLGHPEATPASLMETVTLRQHVCGECPGSIEGFLTIDPVTRSVMASGPIDPRVGEILLDRLGNGQVARFARSIQAGVHFMEIDGAIKTAFMVAVRGDEVRDRVAVVLVDEVASRSMLEYAFTKVDLLQSSLAPEAEWPQLFALRATVGSAHLLDTGASESLRTDATDAPVYGLTLGIGPAKSAASYLEFGAHPATDRATIIVLMLVISALLIMAMLQVRRETELTRLRADFIAGVSHELRTPLAQIRMFTETLLLGRVRSDVERRRSLEIIDQEARRLAYLVENVLLFSKTEGGRSARVLPEPTHFADEVRQAVESFTLLSRNRDVTVRTELQENITVEVDRMALRQIIVNLVDNALKYGPAGQRITVGAALFDDVARLWVDDEGDGIPVAERSRVFDSFYRMPREVDSRVTGSGIGLAVVRELARLHGGDAWVEAAPGRGARIVVQFPDAYLRSEQAGDFAAAS